MTPCNLTATVPLHKYSTEFVFWVTSALSSNVTSLPFQLETVGQGKITRYVHLEYMCDKSSHRGISKVR